MAFKENNPRPTQPGELLTADSGGIPTSTITAAAYTMLIRDTSQSSGLSWVPTPMLVAQQTVDMKTTGETVIFSVPTGYNAVVSEVWSDANCDGVISHPGFSIGASGDVERWLQDAAHFALYSPGRTAFLSMKSSTGFFGMFGQNEDIVVNVSVAASSPDSYDQSFSVFAVLIPAGG